MKPKVMHSQRERKVNFANRHVAEYLRSLPLAMHSVETADEKERINASGAVLMRFHNELVVSAVKSIAYMESRRFDKPKKAGCERKHA